MTVTIYDTDCTKKGCTHNKIKYTNEELFNLILDIQKEFNTDYNLTEHNNSIDINITKFVNPSYDAMYINKTNIIKLNKDYHHKNKKEWKKSIKHEYFHHYQFYNTNNNIKSFKNTKNNNSKRYTAWFMEGSADYVSEQIKTNTPPIILESGLTNDTEQFYQDVRNKINRNGEEYGQWTDNPYTRSYFFRMLSHKCSDFDKRFFTKFFGEIEEKTIEIVENENKKVIVGDESGIIAFEKVLKELNCDFGNQLGEDNKSSLASALLFYQYATAYKNDMTLLSNQNESNIIFVQAERINNSNLNSDLIDLTKKSTNGVGIPAYGAYSIIIDKNTFDNISTNQFIELNITTSKPLTISIVRSGKRDDTALNSELHLSRINRQAHVYYTTKEHRSVKISKDEEYFITLLNPSSSHIMVKEFTFGIKRINDVVINKKGSLMWQDNSDAKNLFVTRYPTVSLRDCDTEECLDEYYKPVASTYCTNLILANHGDWRLPTELELLESKSDTNIFHNFTYDSRYWTDKSVVYYGEPEEENFDLSTGSAHIRCVRDNITYDEKTVEQNLLNVLKLKWNVESDKKEEKLNAFMTQIKETGFVNQRADDGADYAYYYILKKSMKFLGHIVKVIEYDEAPYGHVGCCIDIGISMILKQVGSLDKIKKFAKDNQCTLSSYDGSLSIDYKNVDQALSGETNLIHLSCHHSDMNEDSTDENNISRTSKVKKTGQVKSYDVYGNEVTDGSIKDDGFYQKGVTPSYTRDDEKEIVTDNITKLQWQDNEEAKTVRKKWEDAKSYCANLTLGGYSDWRLPTVIELQSIVVDDKNLHSIDYATSNYYWSSTKDVSFIDNTYAWGVYFGNGIVYNYSKFIYSNVACVRAGQ